eukprot:gene2090-17661_t
MSCAGESLAQCRGVSEAYRDSKGGEILAGWRSNVTEDRNGHDMLQIVVGQEAIVSIERNYVGIPERANEPNENVDDSLAVEYSQV